ncbi:CocE/NonD family hydrolase [Streptomyces sp. NPDC006314]|uniref:alpha/beta hydrolase family protein n=1 Tax=Streptomyces sp. NPDC006314 TaxID=3154475 RepID=UPI00339FA6DE
MPTGKRAAGGRWRRGLAWAAAATLLAAGSLGGVVLWQNSYALREERVTLRQAGHRLDGVLARPEHGRGPFGLVVFVHGDGPIDATHDTFYRPMWEGFARAGYASLSFSKPGIGRSEGNWLHQSMDDRAAETQAAIAWARHRPDIDRDRIGLWGASQAGWVLPKVAARERNLRFVIAVSPAVNWLRQGEFNLLADLQDRHASPADRAEALRRRRVVLRLLERGASYEEYRAATGGHDQDMTADRWRFVSRNYTSDATADLRAVPSGTAVLLVLAGHDRNVDAAETETVYRRLLPAGSLSVRHYPDANHSLVRTALGSGLRLTLTAAFAPRSLSASGFLDDQRVFLQRRNTDTEAPK